MSVCVLTLVTCAVNACNVPKPYGSGSTNDSSWLEAHPQEPGSNYPPPGGLNIKEPRSWQTWQLIVAVTLVGMLCMWIGNLTSGSSSAAGASSASPAYKLPPPASTGGSSSGGSSSSTSSTPNSSAAQGSGATSTTVSGPVTVLVPEYQSSATNWTSTPFTVGGGTWNIGWAFQCVPAPASGPSFEVFVFPNGQSPGSTPAVSGTGAQGQSVTAQTTSGSQELSVQAAPNCQWVVKVTGVA